MAVVACFGTVGTARADTLSFTQTFSTTLSPDDGDRVLRSLPNFDASFGTLASVSYHIVGSAQDSIVGETYDTTLFPVVFHHSGLIAGAGILQEVTLPQTAGFASYAAAVSSFGVDFSASTTQSLQWFSTPGPEYVEFVVGATVYRDGVFVGYADDQESFSGSITETYTYTPVPEPRSAAMMLFALSGLAMVRFRRRSS